jgi:amino acid transporter
MALLDLVLGRRLASSEDKTERVGPLSGMSVFGLDALSSAAYGPEAALTILIPLGIAGLGYSLPIIAAVSAILAIVYFSYRQTIAAYPSGAGSYTVAKENLGEQAGLLAAVALMIDYTLNVAVGISAGIGAIVSAVPGLQPHTLPLCLVVLSVLTFLNLRGVREAGLAFMPPTYLFIGCLGAVIFVGIFKVLVSGGYPEAVIPLPKAPDVGQQISVWLLLKAFAAGCTAMTGVEAVSNGVQAFKEPEVKSARTALTLIVAILIFLLLGVAYLVSAYQIVATEPGSLSYQSILSLVTQAVAGRGIFYYVTIGSILLVLCLSANTSFADFPRVCRTIALDGYLPASFTVRGRRLVFTEGIVLLTVLSGTLLTIFNGVTDRLIPLFAVGAFLAFTLSQCGMVMHWLKSNEPSAGLNAAINGVGALATGTTLVIVIVTKFAEGAWLVVIVIPALFFLMCRIKRHYLDVAEEIATTGPIRLEPPKEIIVVLLVDHLNSVTQKGLQVAYGLSRKVHVVHVQREGSDQDFLREWNQGAKQSIEQLGLPVPELVILQSPYRRLVAPTLDYLWKLERENSESSIAVLIPQLIESHWYYSFLHNQKAAIFRSILLLKARDRMVIVNVPWNLERQRRIRGPHRLEPWNRYPAWIDN